MPTRPSVAYDEDFKTLVSDNRLTRKNSFDSNAGAGRLWNVTTLWRIRIRAQGPRELDVKLACSSRFTTEKVMPDALSSIVFDASSRLRSARRADELLESAAGLGFQASRVGLLNDTSVRIASAFYFVVVFWLAPPFLIWECVLS